LGGSSSTKTNARKPLSMYIPKLFESIDRDEIIAFMRKYSFATIVSTTAGLPEATHLPFVIEEKDNQLTLLSHFARANPQAQISDRQEVLVIFMEPHAYISPSHYEKDTNVPTWNYMAVHAYGKLELIDDDLAAELLLKKMISNYEQSYMQQWDSLPQDYRSKMIKGISAFQVVVTNLQAKKKLSQNRSNIEKVSIITSLAQSESTPEQEIATYLQAMQSLQKTDE